MTWGYVAALARHKALSRELSSSPLGPPRDPPGDLVGADA